MYRALPFLHQLTLMHSPALARICRTCRAASNVRASSSVAIELHSGSSCLAGSKRLANRGKSDLPNEPADTLDGQFASAPDDPTVTICSNSWRQNDLTAASCMLAYLLLISSGASRKRLCKAAETRDCCCLALQHQHFDLTKHNNDLLCVETLLRHAQHLSKVILSESWVQGTQVRPSTHKLNKGNLPSFCQTQSGIALGLMQSKIGAYGGPAFVTSLRYLKSFTRWNFPPVRSRAWKYQRATVLKLLVLAVDAKDPARAAYV